MARFILNCMPSNDSSHKQAKEKEDNETGAFRADVNHVTEEKKVWHSEYSATLSHKKSNGSS